MEIVASLTAVVVAAVSGWFSYANSREQRKFDLKLHTLQTRVNELERENESCRAENAQLRAQNTIREEKIASLEADTAQLRATNSRQQTELDGLRRQIDTLKRDMTDHGMRADSGRIPFTNPKSET